MDIRSFLKPKLPSWIIALNYIALIPALVWPIVFFASIFMFDNPKNAGATFLLFLLINSYPLILLANMHFSFMLFNKNKVLSAILPLIPLVAFSYLIYFLFQYENGIVLPS
jgi:hypothetical protein